MLELSRQQLWWTFGRRTTHYFHRLCPTLRNQERKHYLKKNYQLTGFSVFIDVSLCFVYQGQGLIRKSEIPGRLCTRALCRLRSKYPNPIMNVVKVVALLKVLCFILEIFLSCRSDLGGGMGGLARSPADNRPYFALIFGATLALRNLFFLEKNGLPHTEKAPNRVPT